MISTATVVANKATVAANKILGVGVVDYWTDTRASLFIFPLSHSAHKGKKRGSESIICCVCHQPAYVTRLTQQYKCILFATILVGTGARDILLIERHKKNPSLSITVLLIYVCSPLAACQLQAESKRQRR